jgi:hypothetical protein
MNASGEGEFVQSEAEAKVEPPRNEVGQRCEMVVAQV